MTRTAAKIFRAFWKKEITRVVTLIFLVLLLAGILFLNFESGISSLFEALYLSIVTLSTVGYGDITPATVAGRIVSVLLIMSGMVLISTFTATVSSILISKKIKDGQGVNRIKEKEHVIICGWNWKVEGIIRSLSDSGARNIILINDIDPGQLGPVLEKYSECNLKFVKGDFTDINILKRANIEHSRGVIIVPDNSISSSQGADEKTVFATMTIKSISEKIKVYVQLIRNETIPYIQRAKADDYFISEHVVPYFLTSNIVSPGIKDVVLDLISYQKESVLSTVQIPQDFVGKTFRELSEHFRKSDDSIMIALVQFQDVLKMKNIDPGDTSSIDAFIKRKFQDAGRLIQDLDKKKIILNPPDDYIIKDFEKAVVISKNK